MSFPVPDDLALHVAKGDSRQAPVVPRKLGLPRVLCVDDDERLLAGLELRLRRSFDVVTATSAADALAKLERSTPFAAVISDMRMPHADGARLLSAIRRVSPETTRILLTGQADVASAIAAVNDGEIFRFLLKPIEAPQLVAVLDEAVARHRAMLAQRGFVEQVLRATADIMSASMGTLAPALAVQSARARSMVAEIAATVAARQGWIAEVACVLVHLALARVASDVARRWRTGTALSPDEVHAVVGAMRETQAMLRHVPESDAISDAIAAVTSSRDGAEWRRVAPSDGIAARILSLVLLFDASLQRGLSAPEAVEALRAEGVAEEATMIEAIAAAASRLEPGSTRGALGRLNPGRRLVHDVRLPNGVLFLPKGHDITLATLDMLDALDEESRQIQVVTIDSPRGARA